jgi:hypothetical protein
MEPDARDTSKGKHTMIRIGIIAFASALGFAAPVIAGPLTPPAGVPGPTHKTLTQVEPRTPLEQPAAPADAGAVIRILKSGSYYLTGDITGVPAAGLPSGIVIEASDVTLDLNGFTVQGDWFTGAGIIVDGARSNVVVRNGFVDGWAGRGVDLRGDGTGRNALVEGVHASNNGGDGIRSGAGGVVRHSTATNNGGSGFRVETESVVTDSTATGNGAHGFSLGFVTKATNCVADGNALDGFTGNTVTITGSMAATNGDAGFDVALSMIERCYARSNGLAGIRVEIGSVVRDCISATNGEQTGGVGIEVVNGGSLIERNLVRMNGVGLRTGLYGQGNFFSGNLAFANGVNWDIEANNMALVIHGALAPAILGNSGGASPGSTNPNANYSR